MDTILLTFGSVLIVSVISLIGAFTISLQTASLRRWMFLLVGLAAGGLLGDAFVHLIPTSLLVLSDVQFSITILAGIISFFILEKVLRWHHHHHASEEECPDHTPHDGPHAQPLGALVLTADGIHNFIDGAIIAAGFLVSPAVGIATTIAVILHEIPQEISDFALLIHSGFSRAKALLFNFLSALTALGGAALVIILGTSFDFFSPFALAFTAGGFIYIAGSDLVPELHKSTNLKRSIAELAAMLVGIALMFALTFFE